jgi:hypothetical protein
VVLCHGPHGVLRANGHRRRWRRRRLWIGAHPSGASLMARSIRDVFFLLQLDRYLLVCMRGLAWLMRRVIAMRGLSRICFWPKAWVVHILIHSIPAGCYNLLVYLSIWFWLVVWLFHTAQGLAALKYHALPALPVCTSPSAGGPLIAET